MAMVLDVFVYQFQVLCSQSWGTVCSLQDCSSYSPQIPQ